MSEIEDQAETYTYILIKYQELLQLQLQSITELQEEENSGEMLDLKTAEQNNTQQVSHIQLQSTAKSIVVTIDHIPTVTMCVISQCQTL